VTTEPTLPRSRWWTADRRWIASLVLLAIAVRLPLINRREFWLDEAITALIAGAKTFPEFLSMLKWQDNSPVYGLLMWAWGGLFGLDEVSLRLPGVLFSAVTVWLLFLTSRLFGLRRPAAVLVSLYAALSPVWIYYSLEARSYMLFWCLSLAVLLVLKLWSRVEQRQELATENSEETMGASGHDTGTSPLARPWSLAMLALFLTLAALFTHTLALLLYGAWAWLLCMVRPKARIRVLAAGAIPAVLFVWSSWTLLVQGAPPGATAWVAAYWNGPVSSLLDTWRVFSLVAPYPRYLGELGLVEYASALAWPGGILLSLPVLAGTIAVIRESSSPSNGYPHSQSAMQRAVRAVRGLLLPGMLLAGVGVPVLLSVVRPIALPGRYELMVYPVWMLLWGMGMEWAFRRWRRNLFWRVVAVVWCVGAVGHLAASATAFLAVPPGERPQTELNSLINDLHPDAPVVAIGYTYGTTRLGLGQASRQNVIAFPAAMALHPGWLHIPDHPPEEIQQEVGRILSVIQRSDVVWVVSLSRSDGRPAFPPLDLPLMNGLLKAGFRPGLPARSGSLVALPMYSARIPGAPDA